MAGRGRDGESSPRSIGVQTEHIIAIDPFSQPPRPSHLGQQYRPSLETSFSSPPEQRRSSLTTCLQPLSSLDFPQSDLAAMVKGKGVLELGSGCGVVGMAAAMAGASSVMLTDQAEVGPQKVQGPGFPLSILVWILDFGLWILEFGIRSKDLRIEGCVQALGDVRVKRGRVLLNVASFLILPNTSWCLQVMPHLHLNLARNTDVLPNAARSPCHPLPPSPALSSPLSPSLPFHLSHPSYLHVTCTAIPPPAPFPPIPLTRRPLSIRSNP